jgi:hypothetical protein
VTKNDVTLFMRADLVEAAWRLLTPVLDTAPSARPVPNLDRLKSVDAYISWPREQAKKNGGQ